MTRTWLAALLVACGSSGTTSAHPGSGDAGAASDAGSPAADASAPAPKEIDVFLVAGQSNAVGTAARGASPVVPDDVGLQYYGGRIAPANDPVGNANVVSAWPAFAIAYHARTGHRIAFVPAAVAGSALLAKNDDGHGNWSGPIFDAAIARAGDALAAFRASGELPHYRGVLWAQGETDAATINAGTSTETEFRVGLRDLARRFRSALGGAFYVFQTGTNANSSDVGFAAVRRSEDAIATPLESTWVVARNALGFATSGKLAADGVHYTQDGLNELGTAGGDVVGSIERGGPNRADTPVTNTSANDLVAALSCSGRTVTFQTFTNGASTCDARSFALSYGDGSADELPHAGGTCAPDAPVRTHAYAADGTYAIELDRGSIAEAHAGDYGTLARTTVQLGRVANALPVDVFVIAGQSNALGTSLAPWRAPVPEPGFAFQYLAGNGSFDDANAGPGCVLAANEPVGVISRGSAWPQFAVTYTQHTGRAIAFLPTASGGSSILSADANSWSPSGKLFARAQARIGAGLAAFAAAGLVPTVRGVLWSQGEADARASETSNAAFVAALRDVIARFRTSLGADVPFYVFQSGDETDADPAKQPDVDRGYASIRAGEDAVEDAAHGIHVVTRVAQTFRARGMMNDVVHYDQAGYNELGRTGAEGVVRAAGIDGSTPRDGVILANGEAVVTVNVAASCAAGTWSVDFGDGTVDLEVPGGACAPRVFHVARPGAQRATLRQGGRADVAAGLGHVVP